MPDPILRRFGALPQQDRIPPSSTRLPDANGHAGLDLAPQATKPVLQVRPPSPIRAQSNREMVLVPRLASPVQNSARAGDHALLPNTLSNEEPERVLFPSI